MGCTRHVHMMCTLAYLALLPGLKDEDVPLDGGDVPVSQSRLRKANTMLPSPAARLSTGLNRQNGGTWGDAFEPVA